MIMASMRNWIKETDKEEGSEKKGDRVVVVHCKAGKGRSGTVACSYLIAEAGWTVEDALQRFTERRMRPGFGAGVSIPSQLRWIRYVHRWAEQGKIYVERQVEVTELHIWGIRDGVKISVEGYVDEGKTIKTFHVFQKSERHVVRGRIRKETNLSDVVAEVMGRSGSEKKPERSRTLTEDPDDKLVSKESSQRSKASTNSDEDASADVIFRSSSRVVLPSNDINIDFERRNKAAAGWTLVTSVAHVWFNAFFEGLGPEQKGNSDDSGVFEIDWEAIDGIKGSAKKGTKCFDKLSVVWRAIDSQSREATAVVIDEPKEGETVPQATPADWRGQKNNAPDEGKDLGLRVASPASAFVSRASSMKGSIAKPSKEEVDELTGVRSDIDADGITSGSQREGQLPLTSKLPRTGDTQPALQTAFPEHPSDQTTSNVASQHPAQVKSPGSTDSPVDGVIKGVQHISTEDLPDGQPQEELKTSAEHTLGHMKKKKDTSTSS